MIGEAKKEKWWDQTSLVEATAPRDLEHEWKREKKQMGENERAQGR